MSNRTVALGLIVCMGGACRGSTTGPDPSLVVAEGRNASFQGIDLTLLAFNLSWYPRDDSPMPGPGEVFATIQIEITNRSDAPRRVSREDFLLSTLSDGPEFHTGPRWDSFAQGRRPRIDESTVSPGETVTGWLTYPVPMGELAEDILWSPVDSLAFAIEIPWWGTERLDDARIFGTVRDETGAPLAGVPLTVTPLETEPGIPGVEDHVGRCTGVLHAVREAVTDASGFYELIVSSIHSAELCIDVHPAADAKYRVAGQVRPGGHGEIAEDPELRLDLTVGE
jgi:hypothetical protein